MSTKQRRKRKSFFRHHSLSIVAGGILAAWIGSYALSDPNNHLGSFFGNAIADWTGVVLTVVATKYLYEKGSAESRQPAHEPKNPLHRFLLDHSLVIFLLITGAGWTALYLRVDTEGKWGQVVGNIVSEWTQLIGLVLLTKKLVEQHSKESAGKG
jgi:uncharacterized membrane protein YfcA